MGKTIYQVEQEQRRVRVMEDRYWRGVALANHGMSEGDHRFRFEWIGEAKIRQQIEIGGYNFVLLITQIPSRTGINSGSKWDASASHYQVMLSLAGNDAAYTCQYSQGSGIAGYARAARVMESILTDAYAGTDNFEDFCSNFGLDSDSRKAVRLWETCREVTRFFNQVGFKNCQLYALVQSLEESN